MEMSIILKNHNGLEGKRLRTDLVLFYLTCEKACQYNCLKWKHIFNWKRYFLNQVKSKVVLYPTFTLIGQFKLKFT